MRHNRRDDGQLSCRKREMKTMNANTALDGHTTVIKMAERGGVPLNLHSKPFEFLCNTFEQRMKKNGDHRPRNSAQYERVVELLIIHEAKRTPRQISLSPSVSRSIITQLRKSGHTFEHILYNWTIFLVNATKCGKQTVLFYRRTFFL